MGATVGAGVGAGVGTAVVGKVVVVGRVKWYGAVVGGLDSAIKYVGTVGCAVVVGD